MVLCGRRDCRRGTFKSSGRHSRKTESRIPIKRRADVCPVKFVDLLTRARGVRRAVTMPETSERTRYIGRNYLYDVVYSRSLEYVIVLRAYVITRHRRLINTRLMIYRRRPPRIRPRARACIYTYGTGRGKIRSFNDQIRDVFV